MFNDTVLAILTKMISVALLLLPGLRLALSNCKQWRSSLHFCIQSLIRPICQSVSLSVSHSVS